MSGNMYEWCEDVLGGPSHPRIRGGCWGSIADGCASANHVFGYPA